MPEVAEIHRFASLINKFAHKRVVAVHAALEATTPCGVRAAARGKQLLLTLSSGSAWLFGFGLVGHWAEANEAESGGADVRLWLRFDDGALLVLRDSMKMARWSRAADFDRTRGPDPLDEHDAFVRTVRDAVAAGRLRGEISAALLNQAYFNGIGNYMRAELLHRAEIFPLDAIERVAPTPNFDALLRLCRDLPRELIALGANKYGTPDEKRRFADWLRVYDKGVFVVDSTKRKIFMAPDAEQRFKLAAERKVVTAPDAEPTTSLSAHDVASLLLLVREFASQSLLTDDQVRRLKRSLLALDESAWRGVLDAFDISRDRAELVDSLQQMCALPQGRSEVVDTACLTFSSSNHHHHHHHHHHATTQGEPSSWLAALLRDTSASWFAALRAEFDQPYMRELERSLDAELAAGHTVLPAREHIFNALRLPLDDVRVVILGQDPYPAQTRDGTPHAMGLAFSVHRSVQPLPGSLVNIFKELSNDIAGFQPPSHGDLSSWVRKGVLLLNATLTVRAGEPNSHAAFGWQRFTDQIIRHISAHGRRVVVFLLWGKFAALKASLIDGGGDKERPIVECAHPSPLSAKLFLGSQCFSAVNACLTARGEPAIDWRIED